MKPTGSTVIIGAGISGVSAAYHFSKYKAIKRAIVLERNASYGGLLDNIKIGNFAFDTFVHISFIKRSLC